ncbi:hypothetical protein [Methanoregula sp.]|uniref:hypothetical protein n=1 Tax=Methanoregula sp. TaxID=2052170 RepID=UPI002B9B110F|nr:hypothetical protein [Methanoregula sp.]HVP95580.1 hypothetical protein [Methanoregula sp.]
MYPDRALFTQIVQEEPDLSGAARETLYALYDGPLKIRQILSRVNAPRDAGGKQDRGITESALRKRLDLLVSRGILARAGNERTNPYYFIRRPWLFNRYIRIRCAENPSPGLLDLKVLLGEISRQTGPAMPDPVQPRVISAIGERTERSHEAEEAYGAFRQRLGDPAGIGTYLEEIYDDIFFGNIPASDIDGSLARDFLRFVATAPPGEHEVRFFFWYAEVFSSLDLYEAALAIFDRGVGIAREGGIDPAAVLAGTRITRGNILLHLGNIAGAKEAFLAGSRTGTAGSYAQTRDLFGLGEAELMSGEYGPARAPARFARALELAEMADPGHTDPDLEELRGDILRRTGAVRRLDGEYAAARVSYAAAETIYGDTILRGRAALLAEQAELARACAWTAPEGPAADQYLVQATRLYDEAKDAARRIRSISRFAQVLVGECELARLAFGRFGRSLPKDLDAWYSNAFDIFSQINSKWGLVQCFVTEALLYHPLADEYPDRYADTADKLVLAGELARELGLASELALVRRIRGHNLPACEIHPLTFL